MRTLVVVVESGSGLRAKKATFCEIELRGIIHKTNEQKGAQCRWAQTFRLGEFVGTDGLTMRIKSMKTDRILAQAIIPLERFLSPGTYHESIPLSSEIFLSITLITERSGRQISRSSSVKFVGKTLQKLLKQQEAAEKKNLSLSESAIATLQTPAPANPPAQTNNQSVKVSAVCRPRRMRYRTEQPDREQTTRVNRNRKNSNSGSVVPDAEQGSSVVSDISELSEHNNDMDIDTQIVLKPLGETNHKLFGIPLDEVMENQHKIYQDMNLTVPYFFSEAGKIIRAEGLSVQGIFRIRGKIKDVKALKEKIDAGEEITPEEWQNIHLLTTLMKAFLRELPVPILNFENYEKFISIADLNNLDEKVTVLQSLVASLPENNYNVVTFLFSLLNELSQHPEKTQMNSENLAKVIAPNLIWKEFIDIMDMSAVQDTMKGNTVAQIMIDQFDLIFSR